MSVSPETPVTTGANDKRMPRKLLPPIQTEMHGNMSHPAHSLVQRPPTPFPFDANPSIEHKKQELDWIIRHGRNIRNALRQTTRYRPAVQANQIRRSPLSGGIRKAHKRGRFIKLPPGPRRGDEKQASPEELIGSMGELSLE